MDLKVKKKSDVLQDEGLSPPPPLLPHSEVNQRHILVLVLPNKVLLN